MAPGNGDGNPQPDAQAQFVPVLATMKISLYADGNIAYEAPLSNLPVCFTMLALMNAELAGLQWQRTRREGGGIVTAEDVPTQGPRRG